MELSKRLYAKYEPPVNGITPENYQDVSSVSTV